MGQKILAWSLTPREALRAMTELNDRHALDGRDPGWDSGIVRVLGRYDRAWGPARPILFAVRCVSSENTARKPRVREHVKRYAGP